MLDFGVVSLLVVVLCGIVFVVGYEGDGVFVCFDVVIGVIVWFYEIGVSYVLLFVVIFDGVE